jgi:predicted TIM-barrel fold metal-dependent hydrolase
MKDLIDVHVHLAAFPNETNGCFMSPHFQKGFLVKLVKWKLGLQGETADAINEHYVSRLLKHVRESARVKQVVLLALDGVYDETGQFDSAKTHMMIGNDCVKKLADRYPDDFLYGASVNPQRRDALDELARVIEHGARLIKLLPPSQIFDPSDRRYQAYYRLLADKKVPMLSHIGYEFSVTAGKQEWGFPDRLTLALDSGVDVIGAHACSSAVFRQGTFGEMLDTLVQRYPNFYMDLSATTLPNRASVLYGLQNRSDVRDRLLFGTDYPLSAYATPFLGRLSPSDQWKFWRTKSIFDKQAGLLDALGIEHDPAVARRLLKVES